MDKVDAQQVPHGLYVIHWKKSEGGGSSIASVGSDSKGRRWFAPTNWLTVPSFDWKAVDHVELVCSPDCRSDYRPPQKEQPEDVLVAARKIRAGVEDRHAKTKALQDLAAECRRTGQRGTAKLREIESATVIVSLDEAIYELVTAIEKHDGRI